MASKPLTAEAIAFTEKKMDMTLDDIIKMSKKRTAKEKHAPRHPTKSQGFLNGIAFQRSNKVQRFLDSRASFRQGLLAQRRSNFRGNKAPLITNSARRAAIMPIRNIAVSQNKPRLAPATAQKKAADHGFAGKDVVGVPSKQQKPRTMDALFANMKEKRMKMATSPYQTLQRRRATQQQQKQMRVGSRVVNNSVNLFFKQY